ncbi:MAG: hypothetical protein LLF96_06790 [Eubacteriales bacterium]|nr:hypothetical protein [Eubacteriales bacterium]
MNANTTNPESAFTAHSMTVNGQTFPVEYSISPDRSTVFAFVTVQESGAPVNLRVKIQSNEPAFTAALDAADAERAMRKAAKEPEPVAASEPVAAPVAEPEPVPAAEPAPASTPEPVPTAAESFDPAPAAQERDPKQARGPVPEKSFVGQSITGEGWKIIFDAEAARTRVIFQQEPPKAAVAEVEKAGFFWSPLMKSWNKKLTFRAYRAAQSLAGNLRAVCG